MGWVHSDTYERAHHSCRDADVAQACGGVLIHVKIGLSYSEVDETPYIFLPLNGCSVLAYTADESIPAIRMNRLYCSLAAHPREERVKMLTDKRSIMALDGKRIGHIMGDILTLLAGLRNMKNG